MTALIENSITNIRKPLFNHYAFEILALIVGSYSDHITNLTDLVLLLLKIIDEDIVDFVPYSLQLLALLATRVLGVDIELTKRQQKICGSLMDVAANRGACVTTLCALAQQASLPNSQIQMPSTEGLIIPMFQKLFSSRPTEHDAILFCECVLYSHLDEALVKKIYSHLCRRLTRISVGNERSFGKVREQRFVFDVIHLTSVLLCKYSPDDILKIIDRLQKALSLMIIQNPHSAYGTIYDGLYDRLRHAFKLSLKSNKGAEFVGGGLTFISTGNNLKFCESLKDIDPVQTLPKSKCWSDSVIQMCQILSKRFQSLGGMGYDHINRARFTSNLVNTYTKELEEIIKEAQTIKKETDKLFGDRP
ncbi:hypothetical protein ACOME3_003190 [Neoechinorhynchus agilis]